MPMTYIVACMLYVHVGNNGPFDIDVGLPFPCDLVFVVEDHVLGAPHDDPQVVPEGLPGADVHRWGDHRVALREDVHPHVQVSLHGTNYSFE